MDKKTDLLRQLWGKTSPAAIMNHAWVTYTDLAICRLSGLFY